MAGGDCVEKHRVSNWFRKDMKKPPTRGRYTEDTAAKARNSGRHEERKSLEVQPGSRYLKELGARWKGWGEAAYHSPCGRISSG